MVSVKPALCTRSSCLFVLLAAILFASGSLIGVLLIGGLSAGHPGALRSQPAAGFADTGRANPAPSAQPSSDQGAAAARKQLQLELQDARSALVTEQRASAQLALQLQVLTAQPPAAAAAACTAPAAPAPRRSAAKQVWMMVAIPTVHREGQDYLNPTLASILQQLPRAPGHPLHGTLRIVVADNSRSTVRHSAFEKAKAELTNPSHPHFGAVAFVRNPAPRSEGRGAGRHDPNKAGPTVRQQTRDVIWLLHAVSVLAAGGTVGDIPISPPGAVGDGVPPPTGPVQGTGFPDSPLHATHVLLMEDDFRLCPHALLALAHLTAKAAGMPGVAPMPPAQAGLQWTPSGVLPPKAVDMGPGSTATPWLLLRVCYGLNGAVLHTRDVPALAAYLAARLAARPPDHLLVEWFAGEQPAAAAYVGSRAHFTFRYNLLDHFGRQSSLRAAPQGTFGACYDPLDEGNLFPVEAWNKVECEHDDMQPCRAQGDAARVPPLHLKDAAKGVPLRVGELHSNLKAAHTPAL